MASTKNHCSFLQKGKVKVLMKQTSVTSASDVVPGVLQGYAVVVLLILSKFKA